MQTSSENRPSKRRDAPKRGIQSTKGVFERHLPFHRPLPFPRHVLVNDEMFPGCDVHVAVHFVTDAPAVEKHYAEPHVHDVDEINLCARTKE